MSVMGKERWQTDLTAELHQISIRLGHLEGKEYKHLYPGTPFEWPDWYLQSVLSHELSVRVLRLKQEFDARATNLKAQLEQAQKNLKEMLDPTGAETKKNAQLGKSMTGFFMGLGKEDK